MVDFGRRPWKPRLLPHTFTTNCENNRAAVAPGKTADVTVTALPLPARAEDAGPVPQRQLCGGLRDPDLVAADGSAPTDPTTWAFLFLAFFYGD